MKILKLLGKFGVYSLSFVLIILFNLKDSLEAEYKTNYNIVLDQNIKPDRIRLVPKSNVNYYNFEDYSSPYFFNQVTLDKNQVEFKGVYAPPLCIQITVGETINYYDFQQNFLNPNAPLNYKFNFGDFILIPLIISCIEFLGLFIIQYLLSRSIFTDKKYFRVLLIIDVLLTSLMWYYIFGRTFLSWWL